jgi:hypothetical protein
VTNCNFAVGGSVQSALFYKNVDNSIANFGGDTRQVVVRGAITNGSRFDIQGNVQIFQVIGGINASAVDVSANATHFICSNNVTNSTIDIGGAVQSALFYKNVDNSIANFGGDTRQVVVRGAVTNGSRLNVLGNVATSQIIGGVSNASFVNLAKSVTSLLLGNSKLSLDAKSTVTLGSLARSLLTYGSVAGTIAVNGSAVGSTIQLRGDLAGGLLRANQFGNVVIFGQLNGNINAVLPTVGNLLWIRVPGGTGIVTPANIFAAVR